MASKNLTFDPDAGVPYAANLALYTGADFKTTFNVVDTSDVAYDFQGLTTTSVCSHTGDVSLLNLPDLFTFLTLSP